MGRHATSAHSGVRSHSGISHINNDNDHCSGGDSAHPLGVNADTSNPDGEREVMHRLDPVLIERDATVVLPVGPHGKRRTDRHRCQHHTSHRDYTLHKANKSSVRQGHMRDRPRGLRARYGSEQAAWYGK